MYTQKRSRRALFPSTPGAAFLGWNGPNFMQQTNFTSTAETSAQQTAAAGLVDLTGQLATSTLQAANGDVIRIEFGIAIKATNPDDDLAFTPLLYAGGTPLEDFTISGTIDNHTEQFFTGEVYLGMLTGRLRPMWANVELWADSVTIGMHAGKFAPNLNGLPDADISIQNEFDFGVTFTRYYAILTRIRSGIT